MTRIENADQHGSEQINSSSDPCESVSIRVIRVPCLFAVLSLSQAIN